MIGVEDFSSTIRKLAIAPSTPVIAHASLSAFGEVQGGADALLSAILSSFETLIMPAFTYRTMVVPVVGPPDNGLAYGSYADANLMAEFYRPDMAVDRLMGVLPERLRQHPGAYRSSHPILSFVGVNASSVLERQSINEPLIPIRSLMEKSGWVLLLGVDHTVNTSIHLGEQLAGQKQFVRWALTTSGVLECPHFPGCSDGFNQIAPHLSSMIRQEWVGSSFILAVPLPELIEVTKNLVRTDPWALLCDRSYCERCQSIRSQLVSVGRIVKHS
jgi:aminoglycoside 3-N-acetyltransferase